MVKFIDNELNKQEYPDVLQIAFEVYESVGNTLYFTTSDFKYVRYHYRRFQFYNKNNKGE